MQIMKTLISNVVLVTALAVTLQARADVPQTQALGNEGVVFLGSPAVARLLVEAVEATERTVVVDHVVTQTATAGTERSTKVCVQLNWHGGDVIGTYGALSGTVTSKVV